MPLKFELQTHLQDEGIIPVVHDGSHHNVTVNNDTNIQFVFTYANLMTDFGANIYYKQFWRTVFLAIL